MVAQLMVAQRSDSTSTESIAPGLLLATVQAEMQTLSIDQQRQVLDFVKFLAEKHPSPEKTIWDKIDDRMATIPEEVWERIPADASEQLDHYLYGTPKCEL